MKELKELSANYASEKTNEMMSQIVAQAYADGYRDGYKDREEEIPVNLRDNKTKYVDLGLPSGTLWSANYEKEGEDYLYVPYDKAIQYDIPTTEQWNELFKTCKWEFVTNSVGTVSRIDCAGLNGNVISFFPAGIIKAIQKNKLSEVFFWTKEEIAGDDKRAVHMSRNYITIQNKKIPQEICVIEKTFPGFKLPIRLVRTKYKVHL